MGKDALTALENTAAEEGKARTVHLAPDHNRHPPASLLTARQTTDSPQPAPAPTKIQVHEPAGRDADLSKERNTVERLINKLEAWRGIAARYDKTPDSYLAGLRLRASVIWIEGLTRGAP